MAEHIRKLSELTPQELRALRREADKCFNNLSRRHGAKPAVINAARRRCIRRHEALKQLKYPSYHFVSVNGKPVKDLG